MPDDFNIVNDDDARQSCLDWSYEQIAAGRPAEDVEAELVQGGWSADDAAEIVEQSRRRTRHLRGTFTRADAARATGVRDPSVNAESLRNMGVGPPIVGRGLIGALFGLCRAVSRLWTTRPAPQRPPADRRDARP